MSSAGSEPYLVWMSTSIGPLFLCTCLCSDLKYWLVVFAPPCLQHPSVSGTAEYFPALVVLLYLCPQLQMIESLDLSLSSPLGAAALGSILS